jgi:hypothetical protein
MVDFFQSGNKDLCCGCRACEHACSRNCIEMRDDSEGFAYPHISPENCNGCGACSSVCQFSTSKSSQDVFEVAAYAAWNNDNKRRLSGSSGGIFTAIAEYTLARNGAVFGAAFDTQLNLQHIRIDSLDDVPRLNGSKYVQSDTSTTYIEARKLLLLGKPVYYCGTPCQIAGLKFFLGRGFDNLVTSDLVCHGVPSPKIFKSYIGYLNDKYNGDVVSYSFRSKARYGWSHSASYTIKRGATLIHKTHLAKHSPYIHGYLNNLFHRPVCYNCPYACTSRVGDITLADFWGLAKIHPEAFSPLGVSLVVANTAKGHDILKDLSDDITLVKSDISSCCKDNSNLMAPSPKPFLRNSIYAELNGQSFGYIAEKYLRPRHYHLSLLTSQVVDLFKLGKKALLSS